MQERTTEAGSQIRLIHIIHNLPTDDEISRRFQHLIGILWLIRMNYHLVVVWFAFYFSQILPVDSTFAWYAFTHSK